MSLRIPGLSGPMLRPAAVLLVVLALAAAPFWAPRGGLTLLIDALSLLSLAQMWNLLAGYAGLVSLGQQAFVGIGGYALFALVSLGGLHPLLAVPLAGLIGGVVALPLGALVFRLKGSHLAVGSWVVAEAVRLGVSQVQVLGGGGGASLRVEAARSLAVPGVGREGMIYLLALVLAVAVNLAAYAFLRTRGGLALTAVRDNERAARACGVRSGRLKFWVYVAAGLGASLAGSVIYLAKLRIAPASAFDISWTSSVLFIVVIGGVGTLEGPVVGTVVFFALRAGLADLGPWYLVALGALAVGVMLWAPRGLWGWASERLRWSLFPTGTIAPPIGSLPEAVDAAP